MRKTMLWAAVCVMAIGTSLAGGQTATKPPADPSPYGVNNWYWYGEKIDYPGARNSFADMNAMGIKWARVLGFWGFVERQEGEYQWSAGGAFQGWVDTWVNNCSAAGLSISFSILDPPSWCIDPATSLPRPEAMAAFARTATERYKGKIAAIECFNEKTTGIWPHVASRRAAALAPIQKAVYKAVKDVDANVIVTMPGIWANPMYYLEDMYKAGLKDSFDVMNFHYYVSAANGDPRHIDYFRGDLSFMLRYFIHVMDKYGDTDKPIWVTEIGWDDNLPAGVGEDRMAEYLVASYDMLRRSGRVQRVFWYVLDGGWMGLTQDGRKLQAYQAMADYAKKYPVWTANPADPLPLAPPAGSETLKIANAGFEDDLANWVVSAGAKPLVSVVADKPHSGDKHLVLDNTPTGKAVEIKSEPIPVEPWKTYELRGFLRMAGGGADPKYGHAMIDIEYLDANKNPIGLRGPLNGSYGEEGSTNYYISETDDQWYEVHYPMITSRRTRFVRIVPNIRFGPAKAAFDDIRVIPLDLNNPPAKVEPGK